MTDILLRIDTSARRAGSITRDLTNRIVSHLGAREVVTRDLADTPVPQIDAPWIDANFTAPEARDIAQREVLSLSDRLTAELQSADTLVIGVPIYNFGVPAALKAWIDQVARAGVTFRYTENGPVGLLEGKRAVLAVASGGTGVDSDIDFATGYLRHVLGFIGISDVEVVRADRMMVDADASLKVAAADIAALAA